MGGRLAIVDKRRTSAEKTRQEYIIGAPVEGKVALMFDDMITTAGSICGAAQKVHEAGAREIHVAATHGVLCGRAIENLQQAPIKSVVITDTIPLGPEKLLPKIKVLSVAPILGEAIKRIHRNESVSKLFV
jgi:ribose-phosphate pyrophosphokinase